MYAVGMLGSYLTQGVYAVAGPFQPFGGAVDIIVVQQEDGTFKSSPWYVKFGDFQGVLKRQEKIVDISVNDVPADFHMILDSKGEAYFEKEVEVDEGTCLVLPDGSSSFGSNIQEGGVESVVGTDARVDVRLHEQEAQSLTTSACLPDGSGMAGIAEAKNVEEEEASATQEEQGSGAFDEGNGDYREASLLSSAKTEANKRESDYEAACTEYDCSCMEVLRTQKGCWEAKEQASIGDGSHLALENVRVSSSVSGQMGSEPLEAHSSECSRDTTVPSNDAIPMDVRTVNSSFKGCPDWVGVSLASEDLVKPDRDSAIKQIVEVDTMLQCTTFIAKEESSLQEALITSDAKVRKGYVGDSDSCVKDDPLLAEMQTDDTAEGSEDDQKCKNSSYPDVNVAEDEVFASFECVSVEGEGEEFIYSSSDGMNGDVSCDYGLNRDSLSWDFESSANQDFDADVFPLPESGVILPEEDPGNADANSALLEKETMSNGNATGDAGNPATLATVSSLSKWRLWPFFLRWSRIEKASSLSNQALLAAASVSIRTPYTDGLLQKNGYLKWQPKTKVRTYVPTSVQLASLNLNDGPNKVTFTFSSVLGKTQVDARIYLWKWNTRIVISDVDGTITK
ncbi:hypothetical protein L7F22_044449 [Adiantum nelumboides]|nr:hypothetical protein [Adiantum nelumboides]MCO5590479.1 hypothetical protein [Adiantum nelumboides]